MMEARLLGLSLVESDSWEVILHFTVCKNKGMKGRRSLSVTTGKRSQSMDAG